MYFGSSPPSLAASELDFVWRRSVRGIVQSGLADGIVGADPVAEDPSLQIDALVIDARTGGDFESGLHLLRALYDDPRRARVALPPGRVLALIADGDVAAAFALGRYGIAAVVEERAIGDLEREIRRALGAPRRREPLEAPLALSPRAAQLAPRPAGELPTVAIGFRHAPETLAALARMTAALRAHARESSVFEDVATLIETMVEDGLTCQTDLATKAGASHGGQFVGSFAYYRELRRTRYVRIPDHPSGAVEMDVFIATDEVLHEVLHLLFLANRVRAGITAAHTLLAEEFSVSWWQGVVHHRTYPEWLRDRHILEINDDFMVCEEHQEPFGFWKTGNVFDANADFAWVRHVLGRLPQRACYIGERPDLSELVATFPTRPEARFLVGARDRLAIPIPFDGYPEVPVGLYVGPGLSS